MTTYRYFSPTTVHVLRDGTRIGSLYRGSTGSWYFECPTRTDVSADEWVSVGRAMATLHGKHATPELVEKLNP